MNPSGLVRIEALSKDNYDTWKIQMKAVLVKNDAWNYVNGQIVKPQIAAGDAASVAAARAWTDRDAKAKADLILAINPSELKQIKSCETSHDVWTKLENIYQSKGPARKATLLKQLTLQKMRDGDDIREHARRFFDAVDKLSEMDVHVNPDLLAIMLLYSLPPSFENFRCAIESRDDLPAPETLRVKIIEESDARNSARNADTGLDALITEKKFSKKTQNPKTDRKDRKFKGKCYKCGKVGHKAPECKTDKNKRPASDVGRVCLYGEFENKERAALRGSSDDSLRKWCLDSGCTSHLCNDADVFVGLNAVNLGRLNLASYASTDIKGKGSVNFLAGTNGKLSHVQLNDTLHVPELRTNLMSVAKITDRGFKVIFDNRKAEIIDPNNQIRVTARRERDLYIVYGKPEVEKRKIEMSNQASEFGPLKLWHDRLGHLNSRDLREAVEKGIIRGIKQTDLKGKLNCTTCVQGKMTRPAFPKESGRTTRPLDLIHTDVCGPMRSLSNGGAKYFVTFIDDSTRWCEVRFIKGKNEVLKEFKTYKALMENKHGTKIKCIQSDNGREYVNQEFEEFMKTNGIEHRTSAPYTPQQNGVAERFNRTLVEAARCSLLQSNLPSSFWAEAVSTACYVRNRCPTKRLQGKTPYESRFDYIPNVSYFKSFGCDAYCLNRLPTKGKFHARAKKGVFLGYSSTSKAYRIWLPVEKKVEITRDVKFTEKLSSKLEDTSIDFIPEDRKEACRDHDDHQEQIGLRLIGDNEDHRNIDPEGPEAGDDEQDNEIPDEPAVHRRGRGRPRIIRTGQRGRPRREYHEADIIEDEPEQAYSGEISIGTALSGPEASEWMDAMASEVKSLLKMDTWQVVECPKECKVIGSRIVLRNKYDSDGQVERRKARLVAQGCSQFPGIDFNETYAPVARLSSIRLATALAARYGMKIRQLDVATAYLNGTIDEEVYMRVPKHYIEVLEFIIATEQRDWNIRKKAKAMLNQLRAGNKVCLIKKALYGLRQAGRSWYARINEELQDFGAKPSKSDPCVYYTGAGEDLTLIAVYVDDVLVMSRYVDQIEKVKTYLSERFDIRDVGDAKYCLGLEFVQKEGSITLTQKGYIREILARFGMSECNPISTPFNLGTKLMKSQDGTSEEDAKLPYRELIGSLMYLGVGTRPDIAFSVSHLSQFNNCYDRSHWAAAKRILRYLKGSIDTGLEYKLGDTPLVGFADADWASCIVDRRSYTGFVFTLNKAAISWDSKKQRTVALSSTEAEYMSLSEAVKESIYWRSFLIELGVDVNEDIVLKCDNMGAQSLGKNPVYHSRTKHIDARHHFIREALNDGVVRVEHVSTTEMAADILTKGLPKQKHASCMNKLGLCSTLREAHRGEV